MMQHWLVPSSSQEFEKYEVTFSEEAGWKCDCPGYFFRRHCSHIQNVVAIVNSKIVYLGVW